MEEIRVTESHEPKEPRKKKSWLRRVLLMFLGVGLFLIVLAIVVPYFISYGRRCNHCDRPANADLAKLGTALERLGNELIDLNCECCDEWPIKSEYQLAYLVGPYYGWSGTNRKCEVRIRIVGDEIWACAVKGVQPENDPRVRYIYRIPLRPGRELPAIR